MDNYRIYDIKQDKIKMVKGMKGLYHIVADDNTVYKRTKVLIDVGLKIYDNKNNELFTNDLLRVTLKEDDNTIVTDFFVLEHKGGIKELFKSEPKIYPISFLQNDNIIDIENLGNAYQCKELLKTN